MRDGADRGDLRLGAAVGDEGRQPAHHVEEVPRERLERAPLRAGAVAGGEPDQHGEDRDQRQRQRDHEARERVEPGDRGERDEGEDDGRYERGQVAGDVGLDAGDAAGGQHDEAGGRQVVAAAGGVEEPLAQRPGDLARRTGRRPLADVRRTGPQQHQTGERPRGTRPAAGRRRDGRDHERTQREGLRHRGQPADDPARDDQRQGTARGTEVAEDRRVDRLHFAASARTGVGMWCTAIRLRNTQ